MTTVDLRRSSADDGDWRSLLERPASRVPQPPPDVLAKHGRRPMLPASVDLPTIVLFVATNVVVLADLDVPVVRPLLAVWLLVLAPTRLLGAKVEWLVTGTERLVLGFAAALLTVMAWGLAINTLLPLLRVDRPLDPLPVTLTADVVLVGLVAWRRTRRPAPLALPRFVRGGLRLPWPAVDTLLVVAAGVGVLGIVLGAVRLNNGGNGAVTVTALTWVIGVFALLLALRRTVREEAVHLTLYLQSLSMLLMTSLRGWYITGHDVQREFHVFQLAEQAGRWDVTSFQDAYNACLSITILPTVLHGLTGGPAEAVYKVWTQLAFAVVPVVVYLVARRTSSVGTSLLGVVFFVAFPTFFTDMPFLNRQEIAFVFLSVAMLTTVLLPISVGRRRWLFGVFTVGIVFSHYSTTYVLIGVLVLSATLRTTTRLVSGMLPRRMRWLDRMPARPDGRVRWTRLVVGPLNILVLVLAAWTWSSVLTDTGNQVALTLKGTVQELLHPGSSDDRSSDVTYNLFSRQRFDPVERLQQYRETTLEKTAEARAAGEYLPLDVVDRYPVTLTQPEPLPLTGLGRAVETVGVDPGAVNSALRSGAAKLLQVFVLVGLVALAFRAAPRFRPPAEIVFLGLANFAVVVSQVVLPQVSVDYGVLRAFQQALIVLAPFLATGTITCLRWARGWADRLAGGVALAFLASITGLLPQLTGGYPPQLHLNNAGLYYDIYYLHPQEVAAVGWLSDEAANTKGRTQFEVETDRYTSSRLQTRTTTNRDRDIFPTMLRTDSYILLGYTTVTKGEAVVSTAGDQLPYVYPTAILDETKNRIYDNGGAQVYR